ncbi:SHOCT domain-containing protein [Desulfosporosinus sp. Sb-LF]|uniref:SHOCT domain-containing protein n=1 Tax=Desulfosporosinus sp. Sb-LF TaxID=2560027 RepID=UPI00107F0A09|nr:SHOCT domain-containing protein [Desulfosporosinus sp. Sb-LF]TGE31149.1 SHOCT domain-containing protein [Desulfosporosinus sp. Sb-LF]
MMHGGGSMMYGSGHLMRGFGQGFRAYGNNGWMGWLPLACHLIFMVVVIIIALIVLRRHRSKVRILRKQNDPALKILRERYALGEIGTEEFNLKKQDLSN